MRKVKWSKRLTRSTQEGLHSMEEIVRDAVLQVPPFLCTLAQTRILFRRPPWLEPCSSKLPDSFSSRGFKPGLPAHIRAHCSSANPTRAEAVPRSSDTQGGRGGEGRGGEGGAMVRAYPCSVFVLIFTTLNLVSLSSFQGEDLTLMSCFWQRSTLSSRVYLAPLLLRLCAAAIPAGPGSRECADCQWGGGEPQRLLRPKLLQAMFIVLSIDSPIYYRSTTRDNAINASSYLYVERRAFGHIIRIRPTALREAFSGNNLFASAAL